MDKDYAQTLASFFDDSVFLKAFTQASATQTRQYNYTGGLLVHTVHVAKLALALTKVYPHLKSDLLLTSALLHDVGKIYDSQSQQTLLQGHLMQTYSLVHERTKSMVEEKRNALLHCILAHHGKKEWGSPVNPMIPEAFALHALDKMDMQIPAVIQAIQGQELTSEFHKDLGVLFKF
jgi:3'-5' exoribonuclease